MVIAFPVRVPRPTARRHPFWVFRPQACPAPVTDGSRASSRPAANGNLVRGT